MVAITRNSRTAEAKNQEIAFLRNAVGLDGLPIAIAHRVLGYATKLGVVVHNTRDWRAELPAKAWNTKTGLGLIAHAAETIANHLRDESLGCDDPDGILLRLLIARWKSWGATAYIDGLRRSPVQEAA